MTAAETKAKKDDEKVAGADKSNDVETTKQADEKNAALPAGPEAAGKTDPEAAADGSSTGAVHDGDSLGEDFDEDDFPVNGAGVDGTLGTVAEKDQSGEEYDVPWTYVIAADLPRTSDSDDDAKSWTVQEYAEERADEDGNAIDPVALVPVQSEPGQTFRVSELPNREVAEAAGIDWKQFVTGLPVRADVDNEAPRKGIPA